MRLLLLLLRLLGLVGREPAPSRQRSAHGADVLKYYRSPSSSH